MPSSIRVIRVICGSVLSSGRLYVLCALAPLREIHSVGIDIHRLETKYENDTLSSIRLHPWLNPRMLLRPYLRKSAESAVHFCVLNYFITSLRLACLRE